MKAPGELFDLRMPGLLRGGQEGCGSSRVRRRGWIDAHGVCVCMFGSPWCWRADPGCASGQA
jgi:hypothetical protein